jgi:hypothetical protein
MKFTKWLSLTNYLQIWQAAFNQTGIGKPLEIGAFFCIQSTENKHSFLYNFLQKRKLFVLLISNKNTLKKSKMEEIKKSLTLAELITNYQNMDSHTAEDAKGDWNWISGGIYKSKSEYDKELANKRLLKIEAMYNPKTFVIPSNGESEYFQDVTGQFFDIGLVNSGVPECWFDVQESTIKPELTIEILLAAQQSIGSREITEAIVNVADLYTASLNDYRTKIIVACQSDISTSKGNFLYKYDVEICGFDQYLEITDLLLMCNGVSYRAMNIYGIGRALCFSMSHGKYYSADFHPDVKCLLANPKIVFTQSGTSNKITLPPISRSALTNGSYNLDKMLSHIQIQNKYGFAAE